MTAHAKLSASGAALWLACPGSVHMKEQFPEKGSSVAADEGTLAHELGAYYVDHADGVYDDELKDIEKRVTAFYEEHPELNGTLQDMTEYAKGYADFGFSEYKKLVTKRKPEDPDVGVFTEMRVDFSDYVPGGFGTSDLVLVGSDTIEIIDLKFGKGVPVSAVGNPQIRLYALGTIYADDLMLYDFHKVKMVIYQPRLESVTEEEMTVDELFKWADEVIKPGAKKALAKKKEYHAGPWCTSKFCPGAATCKARAEYLMDLNKYDDDPALMSRDEIGAALQKIDQLTDWADKLKAFALTELQDGRPVPGWKIVEGRSNRKYADEEKVANALEAAGFEHHQIYKKPELLGITAMEKLTGKKKFKEILTDKELVVKPQGKPTLAPDEDSRPEFADIKATDFDE